MQRGSLSSWAQPAAQRGKLLIRMTEDGLLETFPNAPFAYTIAYEQTSPTADDASDEDVNPTVCTG